MQVVLGIVRAFFVFENNLILGKVMPVNGEVLFSFENYEYR